jgi:hypothetical protein
MNTSLIIGCFCCLIIPGVVLVGIHHLIAFILERVYHSDKVKSDGIIRMLRDASIMGYADIWWQYLWYWTFFTIRCAVCLFGFIFALGFATMVSDARSFIKNNQEMITKYEALECPTVQDYIEAYKYNKKYESARLLATEEVGENLKKIDDVKLLGTILENAKNAKKD